MLTIRFILLSYFALEKATGGRAGQAMHAAANAMQSFNGKSCIQNSIKADLTSHKRRLIVRVRNRQDAHATLPC
jgi:hypothetical protein